MISFYAKYMKLPVQVRASFWFVLTNVCVKGISFITLPIFSRILTVEEYGVVSVYQTWVAVFSLVATLSIWAGALKVAFTRFQDEKRIVAALQGVSVTNTLVLSVLIIPIYRYVQSFMHIGTILFVCMIIEVLTQIPINLWVASNQYNYEYKIVFVVTIIVSFVSSVFALVAIRMFPDNRAEAKVIGGLLILVLEAIILSVYISIKGRVIFDKKIWCFAYGFCVPLIPHYLSTLILNQSDRLMISNMCGDREAGIYSVAYSFGMLALLVSSGIEASFTPYVYRMLQKKEYPKIKEHSGLVIWLISLLLLLFICIIPDVFVIMLPDAYAEAVRLIPIITVSVLFMFEYQLFGAVEFFYNQKKFVAIASTVGAALNIFLNYFLVGKYGYQAAAYTTLFCYITYAFSHFVFMNLVLNRNEIKGPLYDVRVLVIPAVILVTFSIFVAIYPAFITRWGVVLSIGAFLWWKRNLIMNILHDLKK